MAIGVAHPDEHIGVPDQPEDLAAGYIAESQSQILEATRALAEQIQSKERVVDEYIPTTGFEQLAAGQQLILPVQFERLWVRIKKVLINGPAQGSNAGYTQSGTVTSPAANANIMAITAANLPVGNYQVQWKVDLDGTVSASDVDNVKVNFGSGATIVTSANDGTVGSYPQEPFALNVPAGNANPLNFKAVAAGTVGAQYTIAATLVPTTGYPVTLQLGDRLWSLTIPVTGMLEIGTECLLLSPQMRRILTPVFAGDYSLELLGYADVRNRT